MIGCGEWRFFSKGKGKPATTAKAFEYYESFDDGLAQGWNDVFGDWKVTEDLRFAPSIPPAAKPTSTLVTFGETWWKDYVFEADLKWVKGGAVAMWVRLQEGSTGERKKGVGLVLLNRPGIHSLVYWEISGPGRKDEVNFMEFEWQEQLRVKIVVDGKFYRAYINDKLVNELEDSTYKSGFVGLDVNVGWNLPASWDNVRIRSITPTP